MGASHAVELAVRAADDEPSEGLLASFVPSGNGNLFQKSFAFRTQDAATEGSQGTRGRGQTFLLNPGSAASYGIRSLSVRVDSTGAPISIPDDATLTLDVFQMDSDDPDALEGWTNGDGNKDGDILNGTGYRSLIKTTLPLSLESGQLEGLSYLSFNFGAGELVLEDGKAYGFFVQYKLENLDGLNSEQSIPFDTHGAGERPVGTLLQSFDTSNLSTQQSDVIYYIQGAPAAENFVISEFLYSAGDNTVKLTWDSRPGEVFAVRYSTDMRNWESDLSDSVNADPEGDSTTETFDLTNFGIEDTERLFIRVEKQ